MAANITKGQKNWSDNFNDLNKEVETNTDTSWSTSGIAYLNGCNGGLRYKTTKIGNMHLVYIIGNLTLTDLKSGTNVNAYSLPMFKGLTDWKNATIVSGEMIVGWSGLASSFWQSLAQTSATDGTVSVSSLNSQDFTKGVQQLDMIILY